MRLSATRGLSQGLRARLGGRALSRAERSSRRRWYLVNLGLVTLIVYAYVSMHGAAYCEPCPELSDFGPTDVAGALMFGAISTYAFMLVYGVPSFLYLLGLRRLARGRSGVRARTIALVLAFPGALLVLLDIFLRDIGIAAAFATWPLAFAAIVRLPRQP